MCTTRNFGDLKPSEIILHVSLMTKIPSSCLPGQRACGRCWFPFKLYSYHTISLSKSSGYDMYAILEDHEKGSSEAVSTSRQALYNQPPPISSPSTIQPTSHQKVINCKSFTFPLPPLLRRLFFAC